MITNVSTGAAIIAYLFEYPELEYLLVDEIEKLKKEELAVLLSIMENQRLIITKKTMTCNIPLSIYFLIKSLLECFKVF